MPYAAPVYEKRTVEVLSPAVLNRTRTTPVTTPSPTESLANNAVGKIMVSNQTPEEKRAAMTAFVTFPGTKEESKERIKVLQEFLEKMQAIREEKAKEIIKLTDTDTYSILQSVYDELNNALVDFNNKMQPLTDITDAIYVLRTNEKTMEAFTEIQADKVNEAEYDKNHTQIEKQYKSNAEAVDNINRAIATLNEEKSFWGFGGVKESARKQIAEKQVELAKNQANIDDLQRQLSALEQPVNESALGEFAEQKAKLRELLDISSDQHKQRQKDLVQAAESYVSLAKDRWGDIRKHLGTMDTQIDNLYDTNGKITGVFATIAEGIREADTENQKIRETLMTAPDDESLIRKMERDNQRMAIEDHIKAVGQAGSETTQSYADLTTQTIRIKTMRDTNQEQLNMARIMHTQGVAGVADRLSVILQAVSSAALGESSAMAKKNLQMMVEATNNIAQKETIRNALGINDLNNDVVKAIEGLGSYGDVLKQATQITHEGLTDLKTNLDAIKKMAEDVQGDIRDNIAVYADVKADNANPPATAPENPSPKTDFFNLGNKS
jgi:hypothetical protein